MKRLIGTILYLFSSQLWTRLRQAPGRTTFLSRWLFRLGLLASVYQYFRRDPATIKPPRKNEIVDA